MKLHWGFEMNEGGSGSTGMVACKDLGCSCTGALR